MHMLKKYDKIEGIGGMCMKEQFLQRMKEYLQEDYEAYVKTLEEDAYRGLRVNTTKISVEAFLQLSVCECKPSAICPETFLYSTPGKRVR